MKKNLLLGIMLSVAIFCGGLFVSKTAYAEQGKIKVVALGDSIAYGQTKASDDESTPDVDESQIPSYAVKLQEKLETIYPSVTIENLAHSGDILSDMMTIVNNNRAKVQGADVITICMGANHILGPAVNAFSGSLTTILANIGSLGAKMKEGADLFASTFKTSLEEISSLNSTAKIYVMTDYNPYYFTTAKVNFMGEITISLGPVVAYHQEGSGYEDIPSNTRSMLNVQEGVTGINQTIRAAVSELGNANIKLVDVQAEFQKKIDAGEFTAATYNSYIDTATGSVAITDGFNFQQTFDPHPTAAGQTLIRDIHWDTIKSNLFSVTEAKILSGGAAAESEYTLYKPESGAYSSIKLSASIQGDGALPAVKWFVDEDELDGSEYDGYEYSISGTDLTFTPRKVGSYQISYKYKSSATAEETSSDVVRVNLGEKAPASSDWAVSDIAIVAERDGSEIFGQVEYPYDKNGYAGVTFAAEINFSADPSGTDYPSVVWTITNAQNQVVKTYNGSKSELTYAPEFDVTESGTYTLTLTVQKAKDSAENLTATRTIVLKSLSADDVPTEELELALSCSLSGQSVQAENGIIPLTSGSSYVFKFDGVPVNYVWYVINSSEPELASEMESSAIATSSSAVSEFTFAPTSATLGAYSLYVKKSGSLVMVGRISISKKSDTSQATSVELEILMATSETSSPTLVTPSGTRKYSFKFNKNYVYTLRAKTSLQSSDVLQFFYFKQGNSKYIEIPNASNLREINISSILKSVGEYKFFAKVNGHLVSTDKIYTVQVERSDSEKIKIQISANEIIGESGGMNSYRLSVQNLNENAGIDLDNLTILWYLIDGDNTYLIRSGNNVIYTPTSEGREKIKVDILQNGVSLLSPENANDATVSIVARSNNSVNVLIWVLAVVGVLSIGLTISIVVKVKSERVW